MNVYLLTPHRGPKPENTLHLLLSCFSDECDCGSVVHGNCLAYKDETDSKKKQRSRHCVATCINTGGQVQQGVKELMAEQ